MKATEKTLRETLCLETAGQGEKNYSIVAGAGAGKTTLLSTRICAQIKEGAPIDSFLIITYTNAAAEELRNKIAIELQERISKGGLSAVEEGNLETALYDIELIQISTIHSFLLKILKENAFESGLAIDVEKIEDKEVEEDKKKFFDEWYDKHHAEISKFSDDWEIPNKDGKITDYTQDVFRNMFYDLAEIREEVIFDTSDHTPNFEKMAEEYIDEWYQSAKNLAVELKKNIPIGKTTGKQITLIKESRPILDNMAVLDANISAGNKGIEEACILSDILATIKKRHDEEDDFYGKRYSSAMLVPLVPVFPTYEIEWNFKKLYDEFLEPSSKAAKVAEYVIQIQKAYQDKIDSDTKKITNDGILFRANKLLESNPDILDKLRNRYTKIYVDEFQDTTGLQTNIVKMLAGEVKSAIPPATVKYKSNGLVVVGDPKQSIYRFTGAEKAIYDKVNDEFAKMPPAEGKKVCLDYNFRSNSSILEWVNNSFGKIMGSVYNPMDTDWHVKNPDCLHGVYRYPEEEQYKDDDVKAVADLVETFTGDKGYFLEEYDAKIQQYSYRTICNSDFLIITKNTTDIAEYSKEFAKRGIPVNVQGKFTIENDEIINNFITFVRFFAKPKNKKNLIAAAQVLEGFDLADTSDATIGVAKEKLWEIKKSLDTMELEAPAIVKIIANHEEWYLPKTPIEVERVREYKIRLNQMIEACLMDNDGDLGKILQLMENYITTDVKREIPLESNENAVRLMNVHQAKGLTGNIVIIANRKNSEGPRFSAFKKDGKYYPAASYKKSKDSTPKIRPSFGYDYDRLMDVIMEEMDEAVRLQYVAATRASHALIFMPAINKDAWFTKDEYGVSKQKNIMDYIEKMAGTAGAVSTSTSSTTGAPTIINEYDLRENLAKAGLNAMGEEQVISVTPSSLEKSGVTGYTPSDSGYVKESRPQGNIFGTVLHRVYELIVTRFETLRALDKPTLEKIIENIINQAILENLEDFKKDDIPSEFFIYLSALMKDYFDKVIVPIMEEAEEVFPEYTFSFYLDEDEKMDFFDKFGIVCTCNDAKVWVNGQTDLVVRKKDGTIKVYDYKSDSPNGKSIPDFEKSLEGKYEGQLKLYEYAIGKLFEVDTVETEIVHLYR